MFFNFGLLYSYFLFIFYFILTLLCLSPIVGFAATSPEGGSNACRFATIPVSTEKFTPEGGSDACRFATTPVSTEEFTPEEGSNVRRRGEVSLKATEGDDKLSFT